MANINLIKQTTPNTPEEFLHLIHSRYAAYNSNYAREIASLLDCQYYYGQSPIVNTNKIPRKRIFPYAETRTMSSLTKLFDQITHKTIQINYTDYDWEAVGLPGSDNPNRLCVVIRRHDDQLPPVKEEFKTMSEFLTQQTEEKIIYETKTNVNNGLIIYELHLKRIPHKLVHTLEKILPIFYRPYITDECREKFEILEDAIIGNPNFKEKLFKLANDAANPEKVLEKALVRRLEHRIQDAETCKRNVEDRLTRVCREAESIRTDLQKYDMQIAALNLEKASGAAKDIKKYTDVIDYVEHCYEHIFCQLSTDNGAVSYSISGITALKIFDDEIAERLYNRRFIEGDCTTDSRFDTPWKFAEAKALFKALFIDKTLEVNVYTDFTFDTERYYANTPNEYPTLPEGCIRHPHLTRFNCWGNHQSAFQTYKPKDDLIGAVTQAMYATQQINLTDNAVLNCLLDELIDTENEYRTIPCLYIKEEDRFDSWENIADSIVEYPEEPEEDDEIDELELHEEIPVMARPENQVVGVTDPIDRQITETAPAQDHETVEEFWDRELLRTVENGIQAAMEENNNEEVENED